MNKVKVLLVSGPVGVGKSSVADTISAKLTKLGVPNALIDFDHMHYAYPRPEHDPFHTKLGLKNLASIYPNYLEVGVKYFIIPVLVEDNRDIVNMQNAMPNTEIFIVGLTASMANIHKRIKGRKLGGSLEWHLKRAVVINQKLLNSKLENTLIDTDEKSIDKIADTAINIWLGKNKVTNYE